MTILALTSNVAYSDENEATLTAAPNDFVIATLEACKSYATEDETPAAEMTQYLLACINDELEMNDYKAITSLPKE